MLKFIEIKKSYGDTQILRNISFEVKRNEIVSIIGKSGAGKSTILRCANMLTIPDSGEIYLDGENIKNYDTSKLRQEIGIVFQEYNLFEHLTVMDNLTIAPVKLFRQNKHIAEKQAMELLNMVGLEDKAKAIPSELSGGQKQRIAIIRTLSMNPKVILLDEPTSALDPLMTNEVVKIIYQLAEKGMTMIIVTHELNLAKLISDKVIYIENGTIIEEGTSDQIFNNSKNERTKKFIDSHNIKLK